MESLPDAMIAAAAAIGKTTAPGSGSTKAGSKRAGNPAKTKEPTHKARSRPYTIILALALPHGLVALHATGALVGLPGKLMAEMPRTTVRLSSPALACSQVFASNPTEVAEQDLPLA